MLVAVLGGIGYALLDELLFLPALVRMMGNPSDLSPFEVLNGNLPRTLVMIVLSWTLVAFGEEIFFRGFLLQGIANLIPKLSGRWIMAMLLSAALFSVTHLYQGPIGVGNAFLAGIFLGSLFILNGRSLWLPILAHGVINTIGFLIIYMGNIY
jgi:membrane protease YdiL (CAAX protease family)